MADQGGIWLVGHWVSLWSQAMVGLYVRCLTWTVPLRLVAL